jgi:transcription initiation factor TFIIH subunit 2
LYRLQKPAEAIRRAIIRHLILILDLSSAMTDRDMRPNRFDLTLEYSREFIAEWFDQNPLGQVGIVGMREGVAERICGLSGARFLMVITQEIESRVRKSSRRPKDLG